jgi:hypothetical protein
MNNRCSSVSQMASEREGSGGSQTQESSEEEKKNDASKN